jgi:hypothetical protein
LNRRELHATNQLLRCRRRDKLREIRIMFIVWPENAHIKIKMRSEILKQESCVKCSQSKSNLPLSMKELKPTV